MNVLEQCLPCTIVGTDGMLGRAWQELLPRRGLPFYGVRGGDIDIREALSIREHIAHGTRTVINCAAWTDVDGAEADEPAADAVNAVGVASLAEHCRQLTATLVHYSTDYVFNGQSLCPYAVDQDPQPINAYGRSKQRGEKLLRESGCSHLLVRTSWLYAPWGKNFVRTMAKLVRERELLRVVDDQRGRPTSAEHLAESSLRLLELGARGTFHVTDGGECSWFEFAQAIAALVRPACRIVPCSSAEYPRPAARPAYSVLDISGTTALIGSPSPWQLNLRGVLLRLAPDS